MNLSDIPPRTGPQPRTTKHIPHEQLDQNSDPVMFKKLSDWMFSQDGVREEPSGISVPGARAMVLEGREVATPRAFMIGREFAHIHPEPLPGSLHLNLAPDDADFVVAQGWGENHFLVDRGVLPPGTIMVYAPRDDDDLAVIQTIITQSMSFAKTASIACGCGGH